MRMDIDRHGLKQALVGEVMPRAWWPFGPDVDVDLP
jgi:hypothetical protein